MATFNDQTHLAASVFDTPRTLTPATSHESMMNKQHDTSKLAIPTRTLSYTRADDSPHDLEKGTARSHLLPLTTVSTRQDDSNMPPLSPLYTPSRDYSIDGRVKECTMWPSRATLKQTAKAEKAKRRGGNCCGLSQRWGALTKRQRLWFKILIALLVIAFAIGVGIGISRAVGGGIWAGDSRQTTIPNGSS